MTIESTIQHLTDSLGLLSLLLHKKKNQWENEGGFLIAKIYVLNENQLILEKEKEDKNKEDKVQIV